MTDKARSTSAGNQAATQREQDIHDFVGPNAPKILERFLAIDPAMEDQLDTVGSRDRFRLQRQIDRNLRGWNWVAFFLPYAWLLYRKLYLWATAFLAIAVGFVVMFPDADATFMGVAIAVTVAMYSYRFYYPHMKAKIAKADALELTGAERSAFLQATGGVSIAGGVLGAAITLLGVASIVLKFVAPGLI